MDPEYIEGSEVIGIPGQCLSPRELRYIVSLADGETTGQTAQAVGLRIDELPFVESIVKRKFGAKTRCHMIARGFILGVLKPRALCAYTALVLIGVSGVLYYKHRQGADSSNGEWHYDTMAGGSHGPAVQDPRYLDLITPRR